MLARFSTCCKELYSSTRSICLALYWRAISADGKSKPPSTFLTLLSTYINKFIKVPCYYASFKDKSCLLLRGSPLAKSISPAKLEANQTSGPSSLKDG